LIDLTFRLTRARTHKYTHAQSVKKAWTKDKILISICAGVQLITLTTLLDGESGSGAKVVRVMPNTPCLVTMMAAGYAPNASVTEREADQVGRILGAAGVAYKLPEPLLDAVTGLSGSGPAYVAHLVRDFSDAGVKVGLPEDVSYGLTLQTFRGTAQMLMERKMTPEALKKMVTSPNGTTHAGRQVMEKSNQADIIFRTVLAGTERSKELGATAAAASLKPRM
jgi:pyrroline-5-carboxylate reductase